MSDAPAGYDLVPVDSDAASVDPVPVQATPAKVTSPWAAPGLNFLDALAAGAQGASPVVRDIKGNYNYQLAPQAAQDFFAEMGHPQDTNTQVALRDPASGEYKVFLRNSEMEEGRLAGIGRVLAAGAIPESMPMVASPSALSKPQQLLQDFERVGVSPNVPAVGQGIASRLAANIASKVPVVGGPIHAGAERALEETGHAADKIAGAYGAAKTPEDAGQAIQSGVERFARTPAPEGVSAADIISQPTRASSFSAKADALYNRFWNSIDPNAQIPLDNTLAALKGPAERFPSSPELGAALTNPKLGAYADILSQSGTLTLPELKEFRSTIGRMLGDPVLVNDIPRADLSAVYGGISKDLEKAAAEAGPDALKAFKQANAYYQAGKARVDRLEPLLNGSPEQTFAKVNRAASDGGAANAGLLRSLQRSMPADEWGNVGAAVIRRMGEPTPGAKDILQGSNFSASTFGTNWNKLSDAAKDSLFGANVPGSDREALEALARVAQAQKNIAKFANPSGTAAHLGAAGLVGIMAEHFLELSEHPITTALTALGAYGASKALMAPGFARWLYQAPRLINAAPTKAAGVERALGALDTMARANPQLADAALRLRSFAAPASDGRTDRQQ